MAFQTGTRVDPRLGALDFSGFTNAANIQAKGMMNLGEAIGGAIEKHQKKKIKKQEEEVTLRALRSVLPNVDDKTLNAINKDETVREIYFFNEKQKQAVKLANLQLEEDRNESATQEKIRFLGDACPDLSLQDRTDLVLGNVSVQQDPETGATSLVNRTTGESRPTTQFDKSIPDGDLVVGSKENSRTLFSLANERTTGGLPTIFSSAQRLIGGPLVGIGADPNIQDPQVIQDQQTLITAQEEILKTLRASPKVLATEMDRLAKSLDITPGIFMDPTTLQSKMRSIDETMGRRISDIDRVLKQPRYPEREKGQLRILRQDLRNFRRLLGVPDQLGSSNDATIDILSIADKYAQ